MTVSNPEPGSEGLLLQQENSNIPNRMSAFMLTDSTKSKDHARRTLYSKPMDADSTSEALQPPTDDFLTSLKGSLKDSTQEVAIITHDFPDPDAVASALGMSTVLRQIGVKPGPIYYTGEVSHPQNKVMVNLLNISMINYEKDPLENGAPCILVDLNDIGNNTNQTRIKRQEVSIKAVVDHHKARYPKGIPVDSRPIGSTAAIIWEYLKQLNFDFDTEEGKFLAKALLIGIKVDTQDLLSDNTSKLDSDAYEELRQHVDKQKLISILNYPLPEHFFDLRQIANMEENKHFENSTLIAGVGIIAPAKRDALPVIADEFLRMSSVQTSVIFGIIEDYVDISVRSNNISIDVGEFLQSIFKTGGGKKGAGRAKIPLGFIAPDGLPAEIKDEIWNVVKKVVMNRVVKNIKGER